MRLAVIDGQGGGIIQLVGVPRIPLPHQIEALVIEVEERLKVNNCPQDKT